MTKIVLTLIALVPFAVLADWELRQGVDSLTDEEIYTAKSAYKKGSRMRSVAVMCVEGDFDVYFEFDQFLGDDPVVMRFRVDKADLQHGRWDLAVGGTAVFADMPKNVAYQLAHGSSFIVEAQDFRGVQHRSVFDLKGSTAAILPVMTACNIDDVPPPQEPASVSSSGMWAVQLGSFSSKENAEKLAADLRRQGYAAFLRQIKTSSGQLHQVRIGPQKDRGSAEAMAARLLRADHKGQVVPHP